MQGERWGKVALVGDGVAGLAADPAWRLTTLTGGRWSTVERSVRHDGHHWIVGLTPAASAVALIVWRDNEVVAHERGSEIAMCAAARGWVARILGEVLPAET